MPVDLNNRRAEKLADEIGLLAANLLVQSDPLERGELYNSILEKIEFLKDALSKLRTRKC